MIVVLHSLLTTYMLQPESSIRKVLVACLATNSYISHWHQNMAVILAAEMDDMASLVS
jgi:hypothetical protein